MSTPQEAFMGLIKFRALMNTNLSDEKARYIWGKSFIKNSSFVFTKEEVNQEVNYKIVIAKKMQKHLLVGNWVKFVGISGSVAAGFAKKKDDIDIFIVVRNNRAWVYRGIIIFRNIFHHTIRTKHDGDNVENKLCINLICEEKDLKFENDMFNFHELMYLIPIYNERYLHYIYACNPWLKEEYGIKNDLMINRVVIESDKNVVFKVLNSIAFFFQLIFMVIFKHSPEIPRLKINFKRGKIEFFDSNQREKRLEKYLETV